MSRLAIVVSVMGLTLLPSAAYAQELTASNCTTTYASALEANALTNGPVHSYGGTTTVGDFTPSTFVAGTTTATTAYAVCVV